LKKLAKFPKCSPSQKKKFIRCEKKVIQTVVPRSKKETKKSAAIGICTVAIGCSLRTK